MNRFGSIAWAFALILGYLAGYGTSPRSAVAGQAAQAPAPAGALPPGDYSRMQMAPDQGEPIAWSIDDMRKAHGEFVARAKRGQTGGGAPNNRDVFPPHVTRTHSYVMVHRGVPATPSAGPGVEIHEGVSDIYYIVGGSGTVVVGGDVEN